MMWGAVTVALRTSSVQILVGKRQPVISAVLRKRLLQRVNVCSLCSYKKDSAIGQMLGVNTVESPNENLIQKYTSAVPFDKSENDSLLLHKPDQPADPKVLRVVILGAPNAGKSTLSNKLLGRKIFPVSKKVHTTRCRAQGVLTEGETQLILLDTPGMVDNQKVKRHKLEMSLRNDPWDSMKSTDVVLVLVDVSDPWARQSLHIEVLKCLFQYPDVPSILVMNKMSNLQSHDPSQYDPSRDKPLESSKNKVSPKFKQLSCTACKTPLPDGYRKPQCCSCFADTTPSSSSELFSKNSDVFSKSEILRRLEDVLVLLEGSKVDLVKQKALLLEVTNLLTEGIVNQKKAVIKSLDKPLPSHDAKTNPKSVALDTSPSLSDEPEWIVEDAGHDITCTNTKRAEDNHAEKKLINQLKGRKGWPHFQEVFMLSAVNGEEVETLKKYLLTLAKPGEWEYHSDVVTTQTPQEICNNIIREKLLEYLPKEIPYNVTQVTELWEEGPAGELVIMQSLLVSKENHVKLLIGAGGQLVSRIAREAGEDLMNIFLCDVRVRLSVKFKK